MGTKRAARAGPGLWMGQGDTRATAEGPELIPGPPGFDSTQIEMFL